MRLRLSISARNLAIPSSNAKVTLGSTENGDEETVLGTTELIESENPDWTEFFTFDFDEEYPRRMTIDIYDGGDPPDWNGGRSFDISSILEKEHHIQAKRNREGGTILAHLSEDCGTGTLVLKMSGIKLKNVEGFLKKSDPFFVLRKSTEIDGEITWEDAFTSESVHNDLSPKWDEAQIDLSALCDGNLDAPIQIAVFDKEGDGDDDPMGDAETTVSALLEASGTDDYEDNAISLSLDGDRAGRVFVVSAELVDYKNPQEEVAAALELANTALVARSAAEEKESMAKTAADEAESAKAALEEAQAALEAAQAALEEKEEVARVAAEEVEPAVQEAEEAEAAAGFSADDD